MSNVIEKKYMFNSLEEIIGYINPLISPQITPIRLQKTLYFLWAIYVASYGNFGDNDGTECLENSAYPDELFEVKFEAWKYGPVIDEVYQNFDYYSTLNNEIDTDKLSIYERDVLTFVKSLIGDLNLMSDFQLVQRSHEDTAWSDVYEEDGFHIPMDNEQIKKDYLRYAKS